MTSSSHPLADLIAPVAEMLLGEPNRKLSSKHELRYGSRGSMSVDLEKGTWFDHETNEGGGVLDLVARETKIEVRECPRWLDEHGFPVEGYRAESHRPEGNGAGGKPQRKIVQVYDYRDSLGGLAFQVVRYHPKDFRQRRPDGQNGYVWNLHGVSLVPYKLPEIIEQMAQGRVIVIPEGEKNCEMLWALGIPASCNPMGAGKWKPELAQYFEGADVVVIPDYDPQKTNPKTHEPMFHGDGRPVLPGQDHALTVARSLSNVAQRVRVLDLAAAWPEMPVKGDVADWIIAGGTAEQLHALIEQAPDWSEELTLRWPGQPVEQPVLLALINVRAWEGVEPKPRRWLVRERIPERNVALLSGQGGIGKTLLMQQLSVATVLGRDWIGEVPEPGPVLFITAEDDEDEMHFRYDKIAKFYGASFSDLADAGLNLMSLAGQTAVMAAVNKRTGLVEPTELFATMKRTAREIRPRWIGLDTAADIFVVNERDRSEVRQCISLLRGVALELNTTVILLAHPSLSGISSGSGLSGSTAWNNSVRARLYLKTEKTKKGDEDEDGDDAIGGTRILEFMKSNYSDLAAPVRLKWRDGLLVPDKPEPKTPYEKDASDQRARDVFLLLIERYNKQDRTVSIKERANNFAPTKFSTEPEARDLAGSVSGRKKLLTKAMNYLFSKNRLVIGRGPRSLDSAPSKQTECIYKGGTLL